MTDQPLDDLFARLERERLDADRRYQAALTALDLALGGSAGLPRAPASGDGARLPDLNRGWDILPGGAPAIDRSLKGRLRAFIWRLVGPSLDAQRAFNAALVDHLNRNAASARETPEAIAALLAALAQAVADRARFEWLIVDYARTITGYVDTKDRHSGAAELRDRVALLEQRLLALKRTEEARLAPAAFDAGGPAAGAGVFSSRLDAPAYVGFEDRFRGTQDDIAGRAEEYLPLLASAQDVVDVGCGRGELLDLLRTRGVRARGVDVNHAMVEVCRARGLDAMQGDGLSYLEAQADGSLGGLVAIQVVEHLEPAYLTRFLETAYHKLRPGAPIVLETINAACWLAFFDAYLRDPTHVRPLHPDTLKYLVEASGFQAADIRFRHPVLEADRLPRVAVPSPAAAGAGVAELAQAVNAQAEMLNRRLFSYTDFAVIARR